MKKTITAVILIISIFGQTAFAATLSNFQTSIGYNKGDFTDIGEGQSPVAGGTWYYDMVTRAYQYGIIKGIGNNQFNPTGNITGAEALTIAAQIHAIYTYGNNSNIEIDRFNSSGTEWYSKYVGYCKANGLIANELDSKLTSPITRAEMVHAWSKILNSSAMQVVNVVKTLPDVDSSMQYYDDIVYFYKTGIVGGVDAQGTFKPSSSITRAEAAAIFMRLVEPDSRLVDVTYSEAKLEGYRSDKRVITGGNVDSVLGGKAEAVNLSNYKDTTPSIYYFAMKETVVAKLIESMLKTARFEYDEEGRVYASFSVPAMPEGYAMSVNAGVYTNKMSYGSAPLNGIKTTGALFVEGNYRLEIPSAQGKFDEIVTAAFQQLSIAYVLESEYPTSNIWSAEGYYGGWDYVTTKPTASAGTDIGVNISKTCVKDMLEYWKK